MLERGADKKECDQMKRENNRDIMPEIKERYSTRYFSSEPVDEQDLKDILLAAALAPSAFNEQPWRFYAATTEEDRKAFLEYMTPSNAEWAKEAPVLIVVAGAIYETHNGLFNYWGAFDSGCAWGYLSLEAQRKGYVTHCMGGFDRFDLKREFNNVGDNHELYAIIALGRPGDDALRDAEKPGGRRRMSEIMMTKKK